MSWTGNHVPTSFKVDLFKQFTTDSYKIALYDSSATLNASTTAYTTDNEVTGTNYTAGGTAITPNTPTSAGTTAYVDFQDVTFSNVTLTARGALIYNTSDSNAAVAVLDFGRDITKSGEDLTITFPAAGQSSAILRI